MPSASFIVFKDFPLVYARVPKVANTSIKEALARHVPIEEKQDLKPSNDRFWRACTKGHTQLLTADELAKDTRQLFSFSFVRDPLDRLFSCYVNKIVMNGAPSQFSDRGYTADMSFDDFVSLTCNMSNDERDVHTQLQAPMLQDSYGCYPDFIGLYEMLSKDWRQLRKIMIDRELPDLGSLPWKNERRKARNKVSPSLSSETRENFVMAFQKDYLLRSQVLMDRANRNKRLKKKSGNTAPK